MKLYGIVSVTTDYPLNGPTFNRHWVSTPSGIVMFNTLEEAEDLADRMYASALEENITDVGYRAREYDSDYLGD